MPKIAIIVQFNIKDGQKDAFLDIMRAHAAKTMETEDGCERFDVMTAADGSPTVFLCEVYKDDAAFDLHRNQPRMKDVQASYKDLIVDRSLTVCHL